MSNHPNRRNNNDDHGEDSRKLWPFFFIIPILGFSFLPITGSTADCTTNGLCYVNPTFWKLASVQTSTTASGTCTTSAIYVEGDGGNTLTIASPPSPPTNPATQWIFYGVFDFDTHVTLTGTTGKITIFDTLFGIGFAPIMSREMVVSGIALSVEEAGSLQITGAAFGANNVDTFGIAIERTGGAGQICIDSLEGTAYVLGVGGTPA